MVLAGGDLNLTQSKGQANYASDVTLANAMRRAAYNALYVIADSNAMNGLGEGVRVSCGIPQWQIVMYAIDAMLAVILTVWGIFVWTRAARREKVP